MVMVNSRLTSSVFLILDCKSRIKNINSSLLICNIKGVYLTLIFSVVICIVTIILFFLCVWFLWIVLVVALWCSVSGYQRGL